MLGHPERSRTSGGAKDLVRNTPRAANLADKTSRSR
jgi:hypothetical protein